MCLVAFAWNAHPRWRLVLAGNRDEFHRRPAAPLTRWDGEPTLIAGRDLEAGGVWFGVGENGRAGVVTNVRDPRGRCDGRSRGGLVVDYLRGTNSATEQAVALAGTGSEYRPFNLVLFDEFDAVIATNHPHADSGQFGPGVHALSNGAPSASWPKTRQLNTALSRWLLGAAAPVENLFVPLGDENLAPDADLPDTGVGLEIERRLSPAFIRGQEYGTRACTVLAVSSAGAGIVIERRFGPHGTFEGESREEFFWPPRPPSP